MLGTGTQADPYQITTVDEFLNTIQKNDATRTDAKIYLKLMNDIDFNTYKGWELSTILVRYPYVYIYGEGHCLSNIYLVSKSFLEYARADTDRGITFYNTIFEFFILDITNDSSIFKIGGTSYANIMQFIDCEFRIKMSVKNADYSDFSLLTYSFHTSADNQKKYYFRRCIMNIDFSHTNYNFAFFSRYSSDKADLNRIECCEININCKSNNLTVGDSTFFRNVTINNSAIFINLSKASNGFDLATNCTISNSYFIIKANDGGIQGFNCSGTISSSFYNKDFAKSFSSNSLMAFTTEQCKDAKFLDSKGFVIITPE